MFFLAYSSDEKRMEPITKTIIQQAEVLDTTGYGENIVSITLGLTFEQAELLHHAYFIGDISYTLVPDNGGFVRSKGMDNSEFFERYGIKKGKATSTTAG